MQFAGTTFAPLYIKFNSIYLARDLVFNSNLMTDPERVAPKNETAFTRANILPARMEHC